MMTQISARKTWNRPTVIQTEEADPAFSKSEIAVVAAVPLFLFSLQFFAIHPSFLLDLSLASLGIIAVWAVRRLRHEFRGGVPDESVSIMNFSSLGALTCICQDSRPGLTHRAERRASCRTCGHAIIQRDPARLDAVLSPREIAAIAAKLRDAAVEARGMAIPSSVENIDQLVAHLHTTDKPQPPNDPPQRAPIRQHA